LRTRLPWITALLWAALALSPLGQAAFRDAFLSGEALSRGIWQPIYLAALAAAILTIVLEALLRHGLWRRRGN
jgi:hypothetical protein